MCRGHLRSSLHLCCACLHCMSEIAIIMHSLKTLCHAYKSQQIKNVRGETQCFRHLLLVDNIHSVFECLMIGSVSSETKLSSDQHSADVAYQVFVHLARSILVTYFYHQQATS